VDETERAAKDGARELEASGAATEEGGADGNDNRDEGRVVVRKGRKMLESWSDLRGVYVGQGRTKLRDNSEIEAARVATQELNWSKSKRGAGSEYVEAGELAMFLIILRWSDSELADNTVENVAFP